MTVSPAAEDWMQNESRDLWWVAAEEAWNRLKRFIQRHTSLPQPLVYHQ